MLFYYWYMYISGVGGTVASWLVCSTPEWAVWVRALAGDIVLCSWARHFTLTMPLSTQVYKWVLTNCWENLTNCGEVTCDGLASHPVEVEILLAASCYRNRDKLWQLWASLGSKASQTSPGYQTFWATPPKNGLLLPLRDSFQKYFKLAALRVPSPQDHISLWLLKTNICEHHSVLLSYLSLWLVQDAVHCIQQCHLLVHILYYFFVQLQSVEQTQKSLKSMILIIILQI